MANSVEVFKALAHESRLQILGTLLEGPAYVEVLAERLQLSASTVSFHLKKLEAAGLVRARKEQYYTMFEPEIGALDRPLKALVETSPRDRDREDRREAQYRDKVLKTFFRYGKLTRIPVQRKKRRIILEQIANGFEFHRTYPEKEVNLIIADFHDDFCTIRRELICEALFTRDRGMYERVPEASEENETCGSGSRE